MATFTMTLKDVIVDTGGEVTVDEMTGLTVMTGGYIGLDFYPIFDENHRPILNARIIDHFYNREIGMETIGMFQLAVRRKMNEIMPFYNKMYLSTQLEFDPLSTVDLTTLSTGTAAQTGTTNATSNTTSNSAATSRAVNSDTPQTALSGNGDYATGIADVNSANNTSSEGTQENTDEQNTDTSTESTTKGYQGAAADLLIRYRESIINVDISVINELEELFMLVWNNGDSYTKGITL